MAGINDLLASMQDLYDANNLTEESMRELMEQTDDSTESLDKFGSVALSAATGVNDFVKQVANGSDKMTAMNGAISGFANALGDAVPYIGGLFKGLGKAATFAIDRLQASHDAFQQLSDAGVIGAEGITGLRDDFYNAHVSVETYSSMLKKNAVELSNIYGTALKGAGKFSETLNILHGAEGDQLRFLGFSIEEIGDTLVNYQKTTQQLGDMQTYSAAQLATATKNYGIELDFLTKLTGESKQVLQQERDERLLETRYRAYIDGIRQKHGEKVAMELDNQVQGYKKLGKQAYKEAMAVLAGGANMLDHQRAIFKRTDKVYLANAQSIINGTATMESNIKGMIKIGELEGKYFKDFQGAFRFIGDNVELLAKGGESAEIYRKSQNLNIKTAEELRGAQLNQIYNTDKLTTTTTNSQKTMQSAMAAFDRMILELLPADKIVKGFAESLDWATKKLREALDLEPIDKSEALGHYDFEDQLQIVADSKADISQLLKDIDKSTLDKKDALRNVLKEELADKKKELAAAEKQVEQYRNDKPTRIKMLEDQIKESAWKQQTAERQMGLKDDDKGTGEFVKKWFNESLGNSMLESGAIAHGEYEKMYNKHTDELKTLNKELKELQTGIVAPDEKTTQSKTENLESYLRRKYEGKGNTEKHITDSVNAEIRSFSETELKRQVLRADQQIKEEIRHKEYLSREQINAKSKLKLQKLEEQYLKNVEMLSNDKNYRKQNTAKDGTLKNAERDARLMLQSQRQGWAKTAGLETDEYRAVPNFNKTSQSSLPRPDDMPNTTTPGTTPSGSNQSDEQFVANQQQGRSLIDEVKGLRNDFANLSTIQLDGNSKIGDISTAISNQTMVVANS